MNPRCRLQRRSRGRILNAAPAALLALAAAGTSAFPLWSRASPTPEQQVYRIAKTLKPIPDDEWKRIAGDRIAQKYEISKGDTLYDISKRLFGDAKYWPKIWALNNGHILNPHVIFPGNSISFLPGTGTSLPGVSVETADNDQAGPGTPPEATDADEQEGHPSRSQEWKMLPPQSWENVDLQLPPQVDPLGFDTRSRVTKPAHVGFDLPLMTSSQKIRPLGLIFADEKASEFISLDDLIFIHPQGDLQVGQTYSIIDEPQALKNEATTRVGWAYPLVGKVRILEQREGMFVGIVKAANHPFTRGASIAPLQPHVQPMDPIPGPSAMDGIVLLDQRYSTSTVAQHSYVFIDRGSDDGVTPGMVFRAYQHNDPNNDKHITQANIVMTADIMVVQTSPQFSTGLVIDSDDYITEGQPVTLLTDVSDLLAGADPNRTRLEMMGGGSPDDLDSLDNGQGLNGNDKRELRQLEKWKRNPSPAASGGPAEEEIPPPAPEQTPAVPPAPAPETAPTQNPAPQSTSEVPPPTAPAPENEAIPPPSAPATQSAPPTAPGASTPAIDQSELPPPPTDQPESSAPSAGSSSGSSSSGAPSDIPPPPPPAP